MRRSQPPSTVIEGPSEMLVNKAKLSLVKLRLKCDNGEVKPGARARLHSKAALSSFFIIKVPT